MGVLRSAVAVVLVLAGTFQARAQFKTNEIVDMSAWYGKVVQVIDKDQMLVQARLAGQTPIQIWLKVPTAGITDDLEFSTDWKKIAGTKRFRVTGTRTFRTTVGGSKTVFVLEPL